MGFEEIEGFIVRLDRINIHCCEKCPKAFTEEEPLRKHNDHHELEEKLNEQRLQEHMKSCKVLLHRVLIFRCTKCPSGFLNHFALNKHQEKHSKSLKRKADIERNNNELKPHQCDVCGLRFVERSTLDIHSKVHEPFPHVCHCGIGFYVKKDLDIHGRLVHPTSKTWIPKSKYSGPKAKSEFILQPEPSESETDDSDADASYETQSKTNSAKKTKIVNRSKVQKKPKSKKKTSTSSKEKLVNLRHHKNEDGTYTCRFCNKIYITETIFVAHVKIHVAEKKRYTCEQCDTTFSSEAYLIVHKKTHEGGHNNIWKCEKCRKVYKTKTNLVKHVMIHTEEKRYTCHLCPKKFVQPITLVEHLKVHANTYLHECEHCKKPFRKKASLELHLRVHTGERPYVCMYCNKDFADPSAFMRHKRTHTGEKPYQCAFCPKAFSDRSAHIVHERRHQGTTFPCTECGINLMTHAGLYLHKKKHKNTIYYQCDYCKRKCTNKYNLKLHIETYHVKTKKYACSYCPKKFYKKPALVTHVTNAHGNPVHTCEICEMEFKTEVDQNAHVKNIHCKKELKYECEDCDAKFDMKYKLREHFNEVHLILQCKKCKVNHETLEALEQHQCKDFEEMKPVKRDVICDHCGEKFAGKQVLTNHIWTVHMISMYCYKCMKRFYTESDFREHKKKDCEKMRCKECNCNFASVFNLKRHMIILHKDADHDNPQQIFDCKYCGRKFSVEDVLLTHLQAVHGSEMDSKMEIK